jgi:hypothetical protein
MVVNMQACRFRAPPLRSPAAAGKPAGGPLSTAAAEGRLPQRVEMVDCRKSIAETETRNRRRRRNRWHPWRSWRLEPAPAGGRAALLSGSLSQRLLTPRIWRDTLPRVRSRGSATLQRARLPDTHPFKPRGTITGHPSFQAHAQLWVSGISRVSGISSGCVWA